LPLRFPDVVRRNDPVVTLCSQHRNRRKMREAAERISAVMGKGVAVEHDQ